MTKPTRAGIGKTPAYIEHFNDVPKKLNPPPPPSEGGKKRKNYIQLPKDYEPELDDDQTFEAVVRIKREGDGKYCVVELDNIELDEVEEDEDEDYDMGKMVMRGN